MSSENPFQPRPVWGSAVFMGRSNLCFYVVFSEEEGEEGEEETVDSEALDEIHTESSGDEEEEEVEEEGAERASQPPQQDLEPQSVVGEPQADPAPAPLPTAPAGQVSGTGALVSCQLC